jgi:predicted secreted protein
MFSLPTSIAVYFIIWWLILFAVLPWGVKSQAEAGDVVPGSEPGAPGNPMILKKVIWTTIAASIIFAGVVLVRSSGITIHDIPFFGQLHVDRT